MAFDPAAYLAGSTPAPTGGQGFDPRAYLGLPSGPAQPEVSTLGAFGRGAVQGATLGFGDELSGLAHGVADKLYGRSFGDSYVKNRDDDRAANAAAAEQHPIANLAGELGGGLATAFVPGLNLARGASLAAHVGQGAAYGAAAGLGSSNADLTKGDVGGALRDTAVGAAIGGATGAVSKGLAKLAESAPERQVERFMTEAADASSIKMRDKIGQASDKIAGFVRDNPGESRAIMKVAKDPEVLAEKLSTALDGRADKLDGIYRTADATTGGIKVAHVADTLTNLKAKLVADPHESRERLGALNRILDNVMTSWGEKEGGTVTSKELRKFVSDLQGTAFSKSILASERPGQEVAREAAGALKDELTAHVRQWAPHQLAELEKLNGESSALLRLKAAADYRALRANSMPRNRLSTIVDKASDHTALAASLATHNPLPYLAKKFALPAATAAAGGIDAAYARLVKAAMAGSAPAQLLRQAGETGVPRDLAQKVISSFAKAQAE